MRADSPDSEIIVVDDCSDVDLSAEYDRLTDMGVLIFRQDIHRRGGAARNRGVREARGTHVSFLDSDDVWLPGRHDLVRRFYVAPGTQRKVMVSGVVLHEDGVIRRPRQPEWRPGSSLVEYVYRDMGWIQTSMLNLPAGIARSFRWNEELRVNQDTDLLMRMDRAGVGFHIDPEPGVIKEESRHHDRLSHNVETADFSYAWYRRESRDWSPAARAGYHLQDRVWRLADSGRRGEAFMALARSLVPPVRPRETARRALSMVVGNRLYSRMRGSYHNRRPGPCPVASGCQAALKTWHDMNARAEAFCDAAQVQEPRQQVAVAGVAG